MSDWVLNMPLLPVKKKETTHMKNVKLYGSFLWKGFNFGG